MLDLKFARLTLLAVCAILICGCDQGNSTNAFGLRQVTLSIGSTRLDVEVADTPEAESTGLMFRDSLPADHGMLFVFGESREANFWMRNTKIPLSIAYLDANGVIKELHDLKPFDETTVRSATTDIAYGLEVNQGWFKQHNIEPGMKVTGIPTPQKQW